MDWTFLFMFAAAAAVVGWLLSQALFYFLQRKRDKVQQRLGVPTKPVASAYRPIVLPKSEDSLKALLAQKHILREFSRKLDQACPGVSLAKFLMVDALVTLTFFGGIALLTESLLLGILAGLGGAFIPVLIVKARRAKRQRLCDDQLPEALDFISRILRAGHSLATSFQMAGEELPDPLAAEFRRCYDHHSVGQSLEDTLKEAALRVDTADFAFFVTAVLIQRQTGGDLAEVLSNIGTMARSRIRLRQHVKAITAEGRLVGYILLALPVIFFFVLYILNPEYAGVLLRTELGRMLLLVAVGMQLAGFVTIRWIVNVRL